MFSLRRQLVSARIERDKAIIQNQIAATDWQIDRLVYELYELTDEEIKIVEQSE